MTTTTAKTEKKATDLGWARPFEVKWFTLKELLEMKTTTTVAQAPLETSSLKTLMTELSTAPQDDPFKVVHFDGDDHLGSGRHRLNVHVEKLGRDSDVAFPCLFYQVDDRREVNNFIVSSNKTRPVRAPEKQILLMSGELNLMIGEVSLLEEYATLLTQNNRRQIRGLFLTDVLARLTNKPIPGITNTLLKQVLNGIWARTFNMKSYATWTETFHYSAENIQAYVDFLEANLPTAFNEVIALHPTLTNWARNGKDVLIGAGVQLFNKHKATIFPDAPVKPKSTETKVKPGRSVMMKIEAKSPVKEEVTLESKVNETPVVEELVSVE